MQSNTTVFITKTFFGEGGQKGQHVLPQVSHYQVCVMYNRRLVV